jgi:DNA-binding GntR family transcriptional regulator
MVIRRLRGVGDEFFVLVTAYLPYTICPAVLHTDFSNDYEANLLQIDKDNPLILLDSVAYLDDGRPIEYFSIVIHPPTHCLSGECSPVLSRPCSARSRLGRDQE